MVGCEYSHIAVRFPMGCVYGLVCSSKSVERLCIMIIIRGLGNWDAPHMLLRERLTFTPRSYYLAMIANCIMRFGWALLISPSQNYVQQHVILILGCVELVRRFIWTIFRIEWEHIKKELNEDRRRSRKNEESIGLISEHELRTMVGHRSASEIIREIF